MEGGEEGAENINDVWDVSVQDYKRQNVNHLSYKILIFTLCNYVILYKKLQ